MTAAERVKKIDEAMRHLIRKDVIEKTYDLLLDLRSDIAKEI